MFSWVSSAIICVICERYWGFIYVDWLSTLACYSPADSADYAEECSRLHYIAEKDSSCSWCSFVVSSAIICVICERYLGFLFVNWLSTLMWIFSRRQRRSRTEMQRGSIYFAEIIAWGECVFCGSSAIISEICERYIVVLGDRLSTLTWIFSRWSRRGRRESHWK